MDNANDEQVEFYEVVVKSSLLLDHNTGVNINSISVLQIIRYIPNTNTSGNINSIPVLQTSNCHFLRPRTPQRTLPEFIPSFDHC